jgi:hypothetical protein
MATAGTFPSPSTPRSWPDEEATDRIGDDVVDVRMCYQPRPSPGPCSTSRRWTRTPRTLHDVVHQQRLRGTARFNDQLKIEPALAESWQTVSLTVWRFKLRRNVKFHNGRPFTADDAGSAGARADAGLDHEARSRRHQRGGARSVAHGGRGKRRFLLLNNLMSLPIMSKAWCEANQATEASDLQQKKENYATATPTAPVPVPKGRGHADRAPLTPTGGTS